MKSEKRRVDSKWKGAQIAKIEVLYLKSLLNVSFSASNSKLPASSVIREFSILKAFNVSIHPPKLLIVMEVVWSPPVSGWIKGNCDGAFAAGKAVCGANFRNSKG